VSSVALYPPFIKQEKQSMKQDLLLLFLLVASTLNATNYYVSKNGAGAGPGSPANPMNYARFAGATVQGAIRSGDVVYLVNDGEINLTDYKGGKGFPFKSGVSYLAYTPGAKVSGFKKLAGSDAAWQTYNSNIRFVGRNVLPMDSLSAVGTSQSLVRTVLIKKAGVDTFAKFSMARWPNAAYAVANKAISSTQLQSAQLVGSTSWVGAEAVVRSSPFTLDRKPINAHNTTTGTLTFGAVSYGPNGSNVWGDGWGFFVQNSLAAMDTYGEWAYDYSTGNLYIYGLQPGDSVKISATQRIADFYNKRNITVNGIDFEGAFETVANFRNADNITLKKCSLSYGQNIVAGPNTRNIKIDSCSLVYGNERCVYFNSNNNGTKITNSYISDGGMIPGEGANGSNGYLTVMLYGSDNLFSQNRVRRSAWAGIRWGQQNNDTISRNYFTEFNMLLDDCGAIYSYMGKDTTTYVGPVYITDNIIKGMETASGRGTGGNNSEVYGVYCDNNVRNAWILRNTISNCPWGGIFLCDPKNITVKDNTIVNNTSGKNNRFALRIYRNNTATTQTMTGIDIQNNVFAINSSTRSAIYIRNSAGTVTSQLGTINNNKYIKASNPSSDSLIHIVNGTANLYYSLATFKAAFPFWETTGSTTPAGLSSLDSDCVLVINPSSAPVRKSASWYFKDASGTQFSPSFNVPPYSTVFGIKMLSQAAAGKAHNVNSKIR
jgi:parallel beta-helix repeat protein